MFFESYLSSTSKIYFQEMRRGWKQERRMWVGIGAQLEFEIGIEGSFSCPLCELLCIFWVRVGLVPVCLGTMCILTILNGVGITWVLYPYSLEVPSYCPLHRGISLIAALFHLPSTQPLQQDKDQRTACDEVQRCSQINSYQAGRCWQRLGSLHAGSLPGQGGRWMRRHCLLSCSLGRSDGRAGSSCSRWTLIASVIKQD